MIIGTDHAIKPLGIVPVRSGVHPFLFGVSPAMRSLERVVADVAPTHIPVLLEGESGTGKEVVALEFHRRSRQKDEAFLKCTCEKVTADSLDAHLALRQDDQEGEVIARGTVFLDEINQLDSLSQNRLLQLLMKAEMDGLNSAHSSARLISATTRNLQEEMRCGRFDDKLYYRINGVHLRLPSLRERKEDIPLLLDFFVKKYASVFGVPEPSLGTETLNLLLEYPWPGNVRELENFARKTVALRDGRLALSELTSNTAAAPLEFPIKPGPAGSRFKLRSLKEAAREASRKAEKVLILQALERTHWNRKRTARELQISYKALLYKLKQLGLNDTGDSSTPVREAR